MRPLILVMLDHMKRARGPNTPLVPQQSTPEPQAPSHESDRDRCLRPSLPNVVSSIPEFPGFSVAVPRGADPETYLERQALADICNPKSFKGLDPKAVLEESGVMTEVWKPLVTSLNGELRAKKSCQLQHLDFDQVRVGMCASASLVEQYAQGEVPEQLKTNEGIRKVFWLRLIRQLAVDCLERGGSITSSRVAAELLGLPVEHGKELISLACRQNLIHIDQAPPHTITLTQNLIHMLNIPDLSQGFAEYLERKQRVASARSSARVQTEKKTTTPPHSREKPAPPRPNKVVEELEPDTNNRPSTKLLPDLRKSIKAVFQDNTGKWLTAVDLWKIVRNQGLVDPISPGRVRQICDELRSLGILRSEDGMFQLKESAAQ